MEARDDQIVLPNIKEEIANSITHGIGVILSIVGLVVLLYKAINLGTALHITSCAIYGATLFILYLTSTIYHATYHPKAKNILRRLDHISIFLLILGTYTPITLVVLNGILGWTLFGIVSGLCFFGILFKLIFGTKYGIFSGFFYLTIGWVAIFAIKPLLLAISIKGFMWILLGGIFYTLGIMFYSTDKKFPYFHAIWHVFVLAGSISHFFMILLYVIPFQIT